MRAANILISVDVFRLHNTNIVYFKDEKEKTQKYSEIEIKSH